MNGTTRREVAATLRDAATARDAGTLVVVQTGQTVAEWLTFSLESIAAATVRPSTLHSYDGHVRHRIVPAVGHHRIDRQMTRACLEDHFMGKLTGLPMGMAPCYTNHTNADQNDQETATMLLAMAGSCFYMGIPMGDDVMLSYQDTGFHDDATLRELLGRTPAPEFQRWLEDLDIWRNGRLTERGGDASIILADAPSEFRVG